MTALSDPLHDLIERLENATEGSRELDARLQAVFYDEEFAGLDPKEMHQNDPLSVVWLAANGRRYTCWANRAFTRSLDAALTLVSEDAARRFNLCRDVDEFGNQWHASCRQMYFGHAPTAPIAICIAALRAREGIRNGPN